MNHFLHTKIIFPVLLAVLSACAGNESKLPTLDLAAAMNAQVSDTFSLNDIVEVERIIPI